MLNENDLAMADQRTLRILITAPDRESLTRVLGEQELDFACTPHRRLEDGTVSVEAYVPESRMEQIRGYPVKIEVLDADASKTLREAQAQVGRGNRFREPGAERGFRGLGRKVKDEN